MILLNPSINHQKGSIDLKYFKMNFIENTFLIIPIFLKKFIPFLINKLKQHNQLDHKKILFNFLKIWILNQIYLVKFIFILKVLYKMYQNLQNLIRN